MCHLPAGRSVWWKNCDRGLEKIRPVGGIVKSWTGHERLISQ